MHVQNLLCKRAFKECSLLAIFSTHHSPSHYTHQRTIFRWGCKSIIKHPDNAVDQDLSLSQPECRHKNYPYGEKIKFPPTNYHLNQNCVWEIIFTSVVA